jgi:hypothetical protein
VEDAPEEWYHVVTARIQTWAMEQRGEPGRLCREAANVYSRDDPCGHPGNLAIGLETLLFGGEA